MSCLTFRRQQSSQHHVQINLLVVEYTIGNSNSLSDILSCGLVTVKKKYEDQGYCRAHNRTDQLIFPIKLMLLTGYEL